MKIKNLKRLYYNTSYDRKLNNFINIFYQFKDFC